jgi:hypothetical protein
MPWLKRFKESAKTIGILPQVGQPALSRQVCLSYGRKAYARVVQLPKATSVANRQTASGNR